MPIDGMATTLTEQGSLDSRSVIRTETIEEKSEKEKLVTERTRKKLGIIKPERRRKKRKKKLVQ